MTAKDAMPAEEMVCLGCGQKYQTLAELMDHPACPPPWYLTAEPVREAPKPASSPSVP